MKRYLPSTRSSAGKPSADTLHAQFSTDLTNEAEKILKRYSQQFVKDLETQLQSLSSSALGGTPADGDPANGLTGVSQLLVSLFHTLGSKPHTSTSGAESSRSQEVDARFRLSQSQTLAEANMTIARGDKNL